MRKVLAVCSVLMFSVGLVGCGESECERFEECCYALGYDECEPEIDASDDQCKSGREDLVVVLGKLGLSAPDACE